MSAARILPLRPAPERAPDVPDAVPTRLARPNDMAVLWAADDAGLSQSEHRLFARVYRRYNRQQGCTESVPRMAEGCRMHPDTARAAKDRLVGWRLLLETPRKGQTSRLDVLDPACWALPYVEHPPEMEGGVPPRNEGGPSVSHPPETEGGDPPETKGDEVNTEADTDEDGGDAGAREGSRLGPSPAGPSPPTPADELGPLPPAVARYADQIRDHLAQPEPERRRRACAALRAGSLPPPDLVRALDERLGRHGPAALAAGLVVCANEATAHRPASRLRYLDSVLDSIADHARRQQLPPAALPETADAALGARPGRGRRDAPGGGRTEPRGGTSGTSAERLVASAERTLDLLRAGAVGGGPPG